MLSQPIVITPNGFGFTNPLSSVVNIELTDGLTPRITYLNSFLSFGPISGYLMARALAVNSDGSLYALLLSRSPSFFGPAKRPITGSAARIAMISVRQAEVTNIVEWPYANFEPCGIIFGQGMEFFLTAINRGGECIRARLNADRGSVELLGSIDFGSKGNLLESPQLVRVEAEICVIDTFARLCMPFFGPVGSSRPLDVEPGSHGGPIDTDRFAILSKREQTTEFCEVLMDGRLAAIASWKNSEFFPVALRNGHLFAIDSKSGLWSLTPPDGRWTRLLERI